MIHLFEGVYCNYFFWIIYTLYVPRRISSKHVFNQVCEDEHLWNCYIIYVLEKEGLMIYTGIYIAKFNHSASAISSDDEIMLQPFKLTSDYDGFHQLQSRLDLLVPDQLIIGLESMAHYGSNLAELLLLNNYKVSVSNLIPTSTLRKNNIRETKTDNVDTFVIAKALMIPCLQIIYQSYYS